MKKTIYLLSLLVISAVAEAQVPEDAVRMSWTTPRGTARSMAIGGAMGSLGGDITSTFINPAGLGFYKTGEFVLSPGFSLNNVRGKYFGLDEKDNRSSFDYGASGFVYGRSNRYGRWASNAIALAVNRTANFNNSVYYRGTNDLSSFSETFAEEFANSGLPIDVRLYDAPLNLGTKLANYTYLIDTLTVNGNVEVVGLPQRDAILAGGEGIFNQERRIETRGGITEVALGFATNMDDRVYLGFGVGIPILNYERTSTLYEEDATGLTDNNFNNATYTENQSVKGFGFNAKAGLIVKPTNSLRLGLGIHTPTMYALQETTTGSIVADLENYFPQGQQIRTANSDTIYTENGVYIPTYKYDFVSPWKFVLSASYVLSEVEDVTKQKGFITADVEYVTHGSSKFNPETGNIDQEYYSAVNEATSRTYKGAFNFRVGGELKFNTYMTRLGFAYYGNPYEDSDVLKARRMNISGGLGYRNKGFFVDLTYVHALNRDINFPYRLGDKPNTFAELRESSGNIMMTLGVKF